KDLYTDPILDEAPSSFSKLREKPQTMGTVELGAYAASLRESGLPSAEASTEYHKRLSFSLTPLIVCGLSIAFSGLFRKNTLLMSLLFSLSTATVYYVAQMLMAIAAKSGFIEPALAVWSVTLAFLAAAGWGFASARS
ncbi:MAG TPA: LptF/LptG family permease, partial [Rectinemataceae bacterium]